jgi:hypothetical protein
MLTLRLDADSSSISGYTTCESPGSGVGEGDVVVRGRLNYRALRKESIVKGAAIANAKADADIQREYKERIVGDITLKNMTGAVTQETFIAKERLATIIPLQLRAQIINQILGDYDFDKAIIGVKPELYAEISKLVDMNPSCFKVGMEMINRPDTYKKLCAIMGVTSRTLMIFPEVTTYDNQDTDQDYYQNEVVKAITEPRRKKDLSNRRLNSRIKLMIINQLLDNLSFRDALSALKESRFEHVRSSIGVPADAFNIDEQYFLEDGERKLELYRTLRRVMGLP